MNAAARRVFAAAGGAAPRGDISLDRFWTRLERGGKKKEGGSHRRGTAGGPRRTAASFLFLGAGAKMTDASHGLKSHAPRITKDSCSLFPQPQPSLGAPEGEPLLKPARVHESLADACDDYVWEIALFPELLIPPSLPAAVRPPHRALRARRPVRSFRPASAASGRVELPGGKEVAHPSRLASPHALSRPFDRSPRLRWASSFFSLLEGACGRPRSHPLPSLSPFPFFCCCWVVPPPPLLP